METIRFRHSDSDWDTEAEISCGDREDISLGEEIHEEAR